MMELLPRRYLGDAIRMRGKLLERVARYAERNKHREVWKRRLYAFCYGATFAGIARIK